MDSDLWRKLGQLIESLELDKPIWNTYGLVNHTKEEIYYGVSKEPEERIQQHAQGNTKALGHWDFTRDTIEGKIVRGGIVQSQASSLGHTLEKMDHRHLPGYKVIQTAGI